MVDSNRISDKKSLHCLIEGRVQGVGFRFFAERVASRLGLTGYVRNLPDGRVEAYAEGNTASLEQFLRKMREGPGYGLVTTVQESWGEPSGRYSSFRITF